MDKLLPKKVVCEITGRPYISLYKDIKRGLFPRPVKQGEGHFARIYFWESEILEWQQNLQRQSYIGDPDRVELPLDQRRREAGRKGGFKKAENRRKQLQQQPVRRPRRRLAK